MLEASIHYGNRGFLRLESVIPEPGRIWDRSADTVYRYGFNGMETDGEVKGERGNHYTTYFRQYDPRLGRWWSNDPVVHPWESPYVGLGNNPVSLVDPLGAEVDNPLDPTPQRGGGGGGGGPSGGNPQQGGGGAWTTFWQEVERTSKRIGKEAERRLREGAALRAGRMGGNVAGGGSSSQVYTSSNASATIPPAPVVGPQSWSLPVVDRQFQFHQTDNNRQWRRSVYQDRTTTANRVIYTDNEQIIVMGSAPTMSAPDPLYSGQREPRDNVELGQLISYHAYQVTANPNSSLVESFLAGLVDQTVSTPSIILEGKTAAGASVSDFQRLLTTVSAGIFVVKTGSQILAELGGAVTPTELPAILTGLELLEETAQLKPLGLGSTGRTIANNLVEEMTMEAVMRNPYLGTRIIEGMKDSRWLGWTKMEFKVKTANGVNAVVHYVAKWEGKVIKSIDDFKFK